MIGAAKRAGIQRVIYASSIQVSFGYFYHREPYKSICEKISKRARQHRTQKKSAPTWPVNFYGANKIFGETLARLYSSKSDLSSIYIRGRCSSPR